MDSAVAASEDGSGPSSQLRNAQEVAEALGVTGSEGVRQCGECSCGMRHCLCCAYEVVDMVRRLAKKTPSAPVKATGKASDLASPLDQLWQATARATKFLGFCFWVVSFENGGALDRPFDFSQHTAIWTVQSLCCRERFRIRALKLVDSSIIPSVQDFG